MKQSLCPNKVNLICLVLDFGAEVKVKVTFFFPSYSIDFLFCESSFFTLHKEHSQPLQMYQHLVVLQEYLKYNTKISRLSSRTSCTIGMKRSILLYTHTILTRSKGYPYTAVLYVMTGWDEMMSILRKELELSPELNPKTDRTSKICGRMNHTEAARHQR